MFQFPQVIEDEFVMKNDMCDMEVYPGDSVQCGSMSFGPLTHTKIGGVTLKPYIVTQVHSETFNHYAINHTVLNITFSNIKWKSKSIRFLVYKWHEFIT